MAPRELPADEFERHREHLLRVASRMLGSRSEAQDAVQEAWIRARHADASGVTNIGGWLTMITARVALNVLRTRRTRPEEALDVRIPDPVVVRDDGDPAHEASSDRADGVHRRRRPRGGDRHHQRPGPSRRPRARRRLITRATQANTKSS